MKALDENRYLVYGSDIFFVDVVDFFLFYLSFWCCFFLHFKKITNNKKIGAAPKIGADGDDQHVYFFTWPNAINCYFLILLMVA